MDKIAAIDLPLTVSHHQFGLWLETIGENLAWLIRHQFMIIILIYMYCSKKEIVFFIYMCMLNDNEVYI